MLIAIALLIIFMLLFARECKLDNRRYREQDRQGDEHIMREIERFKKEKGIE